MAQAWCLGRDGSHFGAAQKFVALGMRVDMGGVFEISATGLWWVCIVFEFKSAAVRGHGDMEGGASGDVCGGTSYLLGGID